MSELNSKLLSLDEFMIAKWYIKVVYENWKKKKIMDSFMSLDKLKTEHKRNNKKIEEYYRLRNKDRAKASSFASSHDIIFN